MDGPRWHLRGMPDLPPVEPGHPDLRSPARFLGWIARGQRGWIAQGVVWGVVWMVSQALVPYALGRGLQAGVARHDTHALVGWALTVLVLAAATAGSGVLRHRVATVNFVMTSARCTQLVLRQAAALGPATRDRFSDGEVATLANADGATVSHLTDMSARFGGAVVSVLLVSVLLLLSSPLLGVVVLVGLALSVLAVAPVVRPLERRERATRALLGDASALSADLVLGLRVLRGVGGEELLRRRFVTASQRVRHAGVRASRVSSGLDGLEVLLPGLYVVVVTWVGARLALDGRIDAGQLVTAYGWSAFLVLPVQTFVEAAKNYAAATAAAGRIVALLATPVPRPDPPDPVPLPAGRDLHDPRTGLTAGAGRLTAVAVDDPHAGSALADRLGGWGPGEATLGGVPLAALATAVLRAAVVVADREPVLLAGTLAEGLDVPAAGPAPTPDEAFAAAAAADVQETVGDDSLPARGRTLSGGQRQRLALARALRTGAPVLVLDEPTSAVDAHTEARVASALTAVRAGLTTVVVTTSPPLLDVADEVVWVSGGTVTARGAHRDLLRSDAAYRSFVTRELS